MFDSLSSAPANGSKGCGLCTPENCLGAPDDPRWHRPRPNVVRLSCDYETGISGSNGKYGRREFRCYPRSNAIYGA